MLGHARVAVRLERVTRRGALESLTGEMERPEKTILQGGRMNRKLLAFTSIFVILLLGDSHQQMAYGQITSPANYSYLTAGVDQEITWSVNGESPKTVLLQYSTDGGYTWNGIGSCAISSGSYDWVIPVGISSWACMVRIQKCDGKNYKTFASTGTFSIYVLNPSSGYQEVFSHRLVAPSSGGKKSS